MSQNQASQHQMFEHAFNLLQGQGRIVGWLAAFHIFTPQARAEHKKLFAAVREGFVSIHKRDHKGEVSWWAYENKNGARQETQIFPTPLLPEKTLRQLADATAWHEISQVPKMIMGLLLR